MAIIETRVTRRTWHGAPLLDVEPFRDWLREMMVSKEMSMAALARKLSVDEARVRRWLVDQPTVSERTVERAGIVLLRDPRLVAQLYPEYDF